MRWTQFFIPTTKETPKDATAASHILMLRSGMIRQLAAGLYSYLPLGYRTLRKVERIVREEMNAAGAIELHMPVLHPIELWQQTNRVAAMGDVLLRLAGPEGDWRSQTVLGPTHEEVITDIARAYLNSYKKLPVNLYQIQTKFRGEARPKSGVLRTREFLMKDAYSFNATLESLDESYDAMYAAYCRIFSRCGLPYVAVEADSGAIGGDASHEFMVLTDAGEDVVALSEDRQYAANTERATCQPLPQQTGAPGELTEVHTPNAGKVAEVCALLGLPENQMIKTLIYTGERPGEGKDAEPQRELVVALLRGDHEVNEIKLNKLAGVALELADERTIEQLTGAKVGFAGPMGLIDKIDQLIIDRDVTTLVNAATGANKTDYHVTNVNPARDFPIAGDKVTVGDIRFVMEGDTAPSGGPLQLAKAIEVGHVFKLGTKYSVAMDATFLDQNGKPQPLIMGCYGIGLNRIVAAAIESNHDDGGICWPISISPFEVLVLALDPRDETVMQTATRIYDELCERGVDVLFDDRDERAGFKFKDADLIGVPLRVVVGKKSLADGKIELSPRATGEKLAFATDRIVDETRERVEQMRNELVE